MVSDAPEEDGLKSICARLGSLYAVWSIQKYISVLFQGGDKPVGSNYVLASASLYKAIYLAL